MEGVNDIQLYCVDVNPLFFFILNTCEKTKEQHFFYWMWNKEFFLKVKLNKINRKATKQEMKSEDGGLRDGGGRWAWEGKMIQHIPVDSRLLYGILSSYFEE